VLFEAKKEHIEELRQCQNGFRREVRGVQSVRIGVAYAFIHHHALPNQSDEDLADPLL
jgi:hypothetical protein